MSPVVIPLMHSHAMEKTDSIPAMKIGQLPMVDHIHIVGLEDAALKGFQTMCIN